MVISSASPGPAPTNVIRGSFNFFFYSGIDHDCTKASLFDLTEFRNSTAEARYLLANSSDGSFLLICKTRSLNVPSKRKFAFFYVLGIKFFNDTGLRTAVDIFIQ